MRRLTRRKFRLGFDFQSNSAKSPHSPGNIKVDNRSDVGDVETSCGHICGHQDGKLLLLERGNDFVPLALEDVAMDASKGMKIVRKVSKICEYNLIALFFNYFRLEPSHFKAYKAKSKESMYNVGTNACCTYSQSPP